MTRKLATGRTMSSHSDRTGEADAALPRSVPILAEDPDNATAPDQPFQEGAFDVVDPDLRHRMISEVAFGLYTQRGYVDGYDVDDWMAAETQVDHVLLTRANALSEDEGGATPMGTGH